jgi:hypothetical protein
MLGAAERTSPALTDRKSSWLGASRPDFRARKAPTRFELVEDSSGEKAGNSWDRNRRAAYRLDALEANFSRLLQGLLEDADGRPVSLSATGFDSVVGQIRDLLVESEPLRQIVDALLRGRAGR